MVACYVEGSPVLETSDAFGFDTSPGENHSRERGVFPISGLASALILISALIIM